MFLMLKTDNKSGTYKMRFRVKYTQERKGDGGASVAILFHMYTTRHGDTPSFHTHTLEVK